jgi:hypothetical protein
MSKGPALIFKESPGHYLTGIQLPIKADEITKDESESEQGCCLIRKAVARQEDVAGKVGR